MIHLRVVAPRDLVDATLERLHCTPSVVNVVHLAEASKEPPGDLILCDVAREDGSVVIDDLRTLGIARRGSIAVETVETSVSDAADRAEAAATGTPADAVVWEEVEARTSESAALSGSFLAFMTIAAMLAAVGIITDSQILIIGAMVVGPEFGPLAGFCVGVVEGRLDLARRSLKALAIGFPAAIALTLVAALLLRAAGLAPETLRPTSHPATLFISNPNRYSVIVALLAGVAGMISLTTAKSGALMGVLISIATIPAAGNVALATAYGNWEEVGGATLQLAINLVSLVAAGIATLAIQRAFYERRRRRHVRDVVLATPDERR